MDFVESTNGKGRLNPPKTAEKLIHIIGVSSNIPVGKNDLETKEGQQRYDRILRMRSALTTALYGKEPTTALEPGIVALAADLLFEHRLLSRCSKAFLIRKMGLRTRAQVEGVIQRKLYPQSIEGTGVTAH